MKNGRWMRLGMGLCLLLSLLFLQGTGAGHCFLDCLEEGAFLGYLEVHNNTPYNIQVELRGQGKTERYGPYKIKSNPNFMRINVANGEFKVYAFVCVPLDQTPVLYKVYRVNVPREYGTVTLTVTTPLGYIPIPK